MARPTASGTESFSTDQRDVDFTLHQRSSASRRRDKPQLSCNLCRRRKIRCDRQQPCANCSLRGHTCIYPESQMYNVLPKPVSDVTPTLQDRLVHLERLVMTLGSATMSSEKAAVRQLGHLETTDGTVTPADSCSETGSMRVSVLEYQYVGSDHWTAIMDSIADLKDHFDREEQMKLSESPYRNPENDTDAYEGQAVGGSQKRRALLLYGCQPANSKAEILSALPPKCVVDRYISRYFHRLDLVASSSVHGPTFLEEYEAFWFNPATVSKEEQNLQIDLYREKLVQCLMMGEYTQGGQYALETFMNYVYVEFRIHEDAEKDVWFLLGLEVNLAKRMGYHRDPKHFPDISPLQGEMRRRVWVTVLLGDILISGQMGMPRMISDGEFDTAEPQNLNDEDLNGNILELPSPRPETEHTTSLGLIARRRILIALGTISDLTASLSPCNYSETMRVDAILHKAGQSIPPPLQMKSMASSVTDSPQTIMARLFLSHMFYKGQIMLHRRFLFAKSAAPDQETFAYSQKACMDAALGTLHIQQVLDEETCPGGQLSIMHWRVGSIMNHLFLTATMILCFLVHNKETMGREEEIMSTLKKARNIWMRKGDESQEARKAAQAASIVLARAGGPRFDIDLVSESAKVSSITQIKTGDNHFLANNGIHAKSFDEQLFLDNSLFYDQGYNCFMPEHTEESLITEQQDSHAGIDISVSLNNVISEQ